MEQDFKPSFIDWLAFIGCLMFNPTLLTDIIVKAVKKRDELNSAIDTTVSH